MNRVAQIVLIVASLTFGWLAMQVVHEFGHILHAWLSGGGIRRVTLQPLAISFTDVSPNPHPQFVAWGGPLWGSLIPPGLYAFLRWTRWSRAWLLRFFAGFCLIANGGYLLGGSLFPVGDAETLLRAGAPRAALAIFGIVATAAGLALWNGIGRHFGLGPQAKAIDRTAAWGMSAAAFALVALELAVAGV